MGFAVSRSAHGSFKVSPTEDCGSVAPPESKRVLIGCLDIELVAVEVQRSGSSSWNPELANRWFLDAGGARPGARLSCVHWRPSELVKMFRFWNHAGDLFYGNS